MSELACAKCGALLTSKSEWGSRSDYKDAPEMTEPSVPKGVLVKLEDGSNTIIANPLDIIEGRLKSTGFDNGCCGSDGLDGPNRACVCGSVVATERNDCWTPAEVAFIASSVAEI